MTRPLVSASDTSGSWGPCTDPSEGAEEYRSDISLIADGIGPDKVSLYLGGMIVASDLTLLRRYGVTTVINCAVNLDINYITEPPDDGGHVAYGRAPIRSYKLGMVDGPGNPDGLLVAGYHLLHGALHQTWPETESYPVRERGNVLVHCRGGRSRSVIVVALYLHIAYPGRYPDLMDAVAEVRTRRKLHPDEWHEAPKEVLIEAARRAAEAIRNSGIVDPAASATARSASSMPSTPAI